MVGVVNGKLHTTKVLERTKEWVVNVNYATNAATLIKFLGGVEGIAGVRPLQADTPLNVRKLFSEVKVAIVPVVSDMSAMQSPETKTPE